MTQNVIPDYYLPGNARIGLDPVRQNKIQVFYRLDNQFLIDFWIKHGVWPEKFGSAVIDLDTEQKRQLVADLGWTEGPIDDFKESRRRILDLEYTLAEDTQDYVFFLEIKTAYNKFLTPYQVIDEMRTLLLHKRAKQNGTTFQQEFGKEVSRLYEDALSKSFARSFGIYDSLLRPSHYASGGRITWSNYTTPGID